MTTPFLFSQISCPSISYVYSVTPSTLSVTLVIRCSPSYSYCSVLPCSPFVSTYKSLNVTVSTSRVAIDVLFPTLILQYFLSHVNHKRTGGEKLRLFYLIIPQNSLLVLHRLVLYTKIHTLILRILHHIAPALFR